MIFSFFRKKKKILAALSGGVDSAVAAHILVKKGYDVTGVFMVQYREAGEMGDMCWRSDYRDAVRVAAHLGIPIRRWHFEEEYREQVFSYMRDMYEKGETPNPDVLCNERIKFGVWLSRARKEGFDGIATGHYAMVNRKKGLLFCAKDAKKDQTYFLHRLNKEQLSHAYFPLAKMTKKAVRRYARLAGIPTAEKEESMGLCFVGSVPVQDFLAKDIVSTPGDIIHAETGKKLGEHAGAWYATVGQRHTGVSGASALYVVKKDMKNNLLFVSGKEHSLLHPTKVRLRNIHLISSIKKDNFSCAIRFRHGGEKIPAMVSILGDGAEIHLQKSVWAPAPGQFAVFYKGRECLGGGEVAPAD